jgi:hypothetical protein
MQDADPKEILPRIFGSLGNTIQSVKLGPSPMGILGTVAGFALIATVLEAWIFRDQVWIALAFAAGIWGFTYLVINRLIGVHEKNPMLSILAGAEIVRLFEVQAAAKDKSIIIDQPPIAGSIAPESGDDT